MKKKTAVLLVCAVCAASVAVGVAAKSALREMRKNPKPNVERRAENDDDALRTVEKEQKQIAKETPAQSDTSTKRPEKNNIDTSRFITEDRAKEVSLARAQVTASDVTRVQAELDFDDGVWKYEVEFEYGGFEYNVDVNAENGSVLEFKKEYDD